MAGDTTIAASARRKPTMTHTISFQSHHASDSSSLLEALRLLAMRAEVAAFSLHEGEEFDQRLAVLLDLFETIDTHDPGLGQRLLRQALPNAVAGGDPAWSRLTEAKPTAEGALAG